MVGLALVCSGLTSIATQSRVFAANLMALFGLEGVSIAWVALGFLLILTGIVFRGIRESMWVNVLCTLVEASGLILVVAVGISYWGSVDYLETPAEPGDDHAILLVMQGAVLAFFAFIGFEDMYNVAEEVRDPQRTIPLGLITAMAARRGPLYRRRDYRRLGGALAGTGRGPGPDHRSGVARRAPHSAGRVHRDHAVRGRQYRARQLRDGLAPDLRHGASRPAAKLASATSMPAGGRRISLSPLCS